MKKYKLWLNLYELKKNNYYNLYIMNDLTINEKKIYISLKIEIIENHKKILDFIFFNKVIYSENSNSFLINISKLSDKIIDNLYQLVFNIIEKNNEYDYLDTEEIKEYLNIQENNIGIKTENIFDVYLNDFNNKEKELIKLSKNYKFE